MNIEITGKKIEITPPIRAYVDDQLKKITKFLPRITEVQLVLTVQKYRHIAELNIHAGRATYTSLEETNDLYTAINLVFDKIKKQGRRRRKKVIGLHRKRKTKEQELLSSGIHSEASSNVRILTFDGFSLKPMDIEEASMRLSDSGDIFLVFRNAENEKINVIYQRKDGNHGLIEPEK